MAHFAFFYGIKQFYPEPEGLWITGDNMYREVMIKWPLPESPCKITVKGYNEDDTYEHSVYVWLLTEVEVEARPWRMLMDFIKAFKRLVGM